MLPVGAFLPRQSVSFNLTPSRFMYTREQQGKQSNINDILMSAGGSQFTNTWCVDVN